MRRSWNRDAPWYDGCMRPYDRLLVGDGRSWAGAQASGTVLEVGVGTGLNLPHYPAGAEAVGIDLSPGMLARARPRAATCPAAVTLVVASAAALPFPDARFDTVVCTLALCCMPDDRAAVREMHRVLRPGGRLVLLDHILATAFPVRALQRLVVPPLRHLSSAYRPGRPLLLAERTGFTVTLRERYCLGMIERLVAVKEPVLTGPRRKRPGPRLARRRCPPACPRPARVSGPRPDDWRRSVNVLRPVRACSVPWCCRRALVSRRQASGAVSPGCRRTPLVRRNEHPPGPKGLRGLGSVPECDRVATHGREPSLIRKVSHDQTTSRPYRCSRRDRPGRLGRIHRARPGAHSRDGRDERMHRHGLAHARHDVGHAHAYGGNGSAGCPLARPGARARGGLRGAPDVRS